MVILEEFNNQQSPQLGEIDSRASQLKIKSTIDEIMKTLFECQLPQFNSTLKFIVPYILSSAEFPIPEKKLCKQISISSAAPLAFSNINPKVFPFIYLAILFEKSVIFFTKNKAVLFSTIYSFIKCLYPFKWPYPLIYSIPEDILTILESPVPLLGGILQNLQYLQKKKIIEQNPQCIFIDLDSTITKIYNPLN